MEFLMSEFHSLLKLGNVVVFDLYDDRWKQTRSVRIHFAWICDIVYLEAGNIATENWNGSCCLIDTNTGLNAYFHSYER